LNIALDEVDGFEELRILIQHPARMRKDVEALQPRPIDEVIDLARGFLPQVGFRASTDDDS